MRWPLLWLFWFSWFGWMGRAHAQGVNAGPSLSIKPVPSWVLHHEATTASVGEFDGPVTYLLVDRQDSFVGPAPQSFFRLVGRINNPAGLDELSQIIADFDPGYEKLIFHHITIKRDQDQPVITLKPTDFEMIRREKDSERQIFDGTLTASYLLHDLRVGDVVDYAYSVVGQQPLLGKKYSGRHDLNWTVPVLEAQIRQIWPREASVQWKANRADVAIQQRVEGSGLIMQWTGRKLPPQLSEDQVPEWMDPMDTLTFSSWKDWDEVVRWALPFYQVKGASDQAVEDMAQRIRERVQEQKAQVEEAIRFVQDDIRYVGIELGSGSFVPRQPDEVLRKRFGDCKDKALLLTRLIQRLGYEAFPILVRSEGGQELEAMPATPLAFNHVIVGVKDPAKGALYWVDGTLSHQGVKLESRDYPGFYVGLPLREGARELLKQDPALTPVGRIDYQERYETQDFLEPIVLTIQSRFSGWQAEKMRADLAAQGSVVLSDNLANYIKKLYPAAEIQQAPVFQDDRLGNELTITESYSVPDLWRQTDSGAWRLDVAAGAYISQYLMQPEKVKRVHPVAQMFPLQITHRQDVVIPAEWSVPAHDFTIENSGFRYHLTQTFADGVLSFVHDYTSLADHVDVRDLAVYLEDADQVRQELGRFVTYQPKASPTFWERFTVAFPQILGLFILFLVAIGWQLQSDDWVNQRMIWPQRSLLFMFVMLILSSGAFALFWYADADRRMRKTGRSIAPRSLLWLSLGIFAAALTSRGIQVIMDPASFQEAPLPMLAVIPVLHLLWAALMLRLLKQEFPELGWHSWASWIFGPLYFQSKMQRLPIPHSDAALVPAPENPATEPLLVISSLHPAEEGHEPRSEGV
ncbi:MAG TPA: DUF3857 domain-containing protein [Oligoflexus sp.]|uniref:DUF3857 domain-containing protein n=1 Tax=Oligoflexus sp. TaxID=1971216 RepID=UPI002D7EA4B5|nr:DUF3857 domain-containing protein [Oligoflexus sp.]HET9238207.1 DUF3857 domain-containing protein [Oligoflexus sp.]